MLQTSKFELILPDHTQRCPANLLYFIADALSGPFRLTIEMLVSSVQRHVHWHSNNFGVGPPQVIFNWRDDVSQLL